MKKTKKGKDGESIDDIFNSLVKLSNDDMLVRKGVDEINDGFIYRSSGVYALDWIVSKGRGLPKGKIIEIFGPENCGKTSLANRIFSFWQDAGKVVMLDYEHRYNIEYAIQHGVSREKLMFIQPRSGEKGLELVERRIVRASGVEVVAIDSIPAIITKQEMKGEYGDANIGGQARLVSQFVRQLSSRLKRTSPLVIVTNQLRDAVGDMFKSEKTSGGRALKFFASLRINMRKKEKIKKSDVVVGHKIKITIEKSSVGPAHGEIEVPFYYDKGFDNFPFILMMAKKYGIFKQWCFHLNEKEYSEKKVKLNTRIQHRVWLTILAEIERIEDEEKAEKAKAKAEKEEKRKVVHYKLKPNKSNVGKEEEVDE